LRTVALTLAKNLAGTPAAFNTAWASVPVINGARLGVADRIRFVARAISIFNRDAVRIPPAVNFALPFFTGDTIPTGSITLTREPGISRTLSSPITVRASGAYFPIIGSAARNDELSFAVGIFAVVIHIRSRSNRIAVYLIALEPNPPGAIIVVFGPAVLANLVVAVVGITDFFTFLGIANFRWIYA